MHEELKNLSDSINRENEMYINRGDKIIEKREIVLEIKNNGLEDQKTLDLFSQYCENKKAEFEKENPETAEIEMAMHLADIYFEAGITDIAMDNLASAEEKAQKINNEELLRRIEEQKSLMQETLKM